MAATDTFAHEDYELSSPAARAEAVTPHDTNELTRVSRALYVGGAGNVKLTLVSGDVITFTAVPVGLLLPVRAKLVWSTGTTATAIVSLV